MTKPKRVRSADPTPGNATDFPEALDRPVSTPRGERGRVRQPGHDSAKTAFPEMARPRAL